MLGPVASFIAARQAAGPNKQAAALHARMHEPEMGKQMLQAFKRSGEHRELGVHTPRVLISVGNTHSRPHR